MEIETFRLRSNDQSGKRTRAENSYQGRGVRGQFLAVSRTKQFTECLVETSSGAELCSIYFEEKETDWYNDEKGNRGEWTRYVQRPRMLPVSCIESAEHVQRTIAQGGWFSWSGSQKVQNSLAEVSLDCGGGLEASLSRDEDLPRTVAEHLEDGNSVADPMITPKIGEGWAFVNKKGEKRKDGEWTVHCAAVVGRVGELVITIERFANDHAKRIVTNSHWTFYLYNGLRGFKTSYRDPMPSRNFAVGLSSIDGVTDATISGSTISPSPSTAESSSPSGSPAATRRRTGSLSTST